MVVMFALGALFAWSLVQRRVRALEQTEQALQEFEASVNATLEEYDVDTTRNPFEVYREQQDSRFQESVVRLSA